MEEIRYLLYNYLEIWLHENIYLCQIKNVRNLQGGILLKLCEVKVKNQWQGGHKIKQGRRVISKLKLLNEQEHHDQS